MMSGGERRLGFAGAGSVLGQTTDDRGVYRIYGLPAGDYVVMASPRLGAPGDIQLMTDADIRAALDELQMPAVQSRPGVGAGQAPSALQPQVTPRTVGYAPVYFPGTTMQSQAATVTLGVGEERSGVDFALQLVGTAKVEGTIVTPEGITPQSVSITMITGEVSLLGVDRVRFGRGEADGRFSFPGLPPGQYTISARTVRPTGGEPARSPGGRGGQPAGDVFWALATIAVDGQDVSNVTLALQPGLMLSGRLQFEGTMAPPADLARVRINLGPGQAGEQVTVSSGPGQVEADGTFVLRGLSPGRFRLTASIPGQPAGRGWVLKSAVVGDRDAADIPVEIRPGENLTGAVVTFTDRPTELTGTVQDTAGQPAPDCHLIIFASDKRFWTSPSRRIQSVRPANDGKFVVRNLPPGAYLLAAVFDVEQGEWFDPNFLERLVPTSMTVTLTEGERKVQDVRIGG
jgi:hypothetical protein